MRFGVQARGRAPAPHHPDLEAGIAKTVGAQVKTGYAVSCVKPIEEMSYGEVVAGIESLSRGLARFWSESEGWAPVEAAGLLSKARLDWQVSLSGTLRLWDRDEHTTLTDGELILAWANLGSLLEGSLKLLLSVYYKDYAADLEALKKSNAYDHKKGKPHSPDALTLEPLRLFMKERDLLSADGHKLLELVQQRRNAIHAFKNRPIGNEGEFQGAVRGYLVLLRSVNKRLPYPDDVYEPREAVST